VYQQISIFRDKRRPALFGIGLQYSELIFKIIKKKKKKTKNILLKEKFLLGKKVCEDET